VALGASRGHFCVDATDSAPALCEQVWFAELAPNQATDPKTCTLDGDYEVSYDIQCRPFRVPNCPLDKDTNKAVVSFSLKSSNFCPQVVDALSLEYSFNVYQFADFSAVKDDFLHGQVMYFTIPVRSREASLAAAHIWDLSLKKTNVNGVNSTLVLIANGLPTQLASDNFNLTVAGGLPVAANVFSVPRFNMTLNTFFLGVPEDRQEVIEFTARIRLQYANAGQAQLLSVTFDSADLQAGRGVQDVGASKTVVIERRGAGGKNAILGDNGKPTLTGAIALGAICVAGVALIVVAAIAIDRRRSRKYERLLESSGSKSAIFMSKLSNQASAPAIAEDEHSVASSLSLRDIHSAYSHVDRV
jgi:subtilase family serine protease